MWGRGLATEVAVATTGLADYLGLYRLFALCHSDNVASARVLAKSGFIREGVLGRHTCVRIWASMGRRTSRFKLELPAERSGLGGWVCRSRGRAIRQLDEPPPPVAGAPEATERS
jgi:hypothetical protein